MISRNNKFNPQARRNMKVNYSTDFQNLCTQLSAQNYGKRYTSDSTMKDLNITKYLTEVPESLSKYQGYTERKYAFTKLLSKNSNKVISQKPSFPLEGSFSTKRNHKSKPRPKKPEMLPLICNLPQASNRLTENRWQSPETAVNFDPIDYYFNSKMYCSKITPLPSSRRKKAPLVSSLKPQEDLEGIKLSLKITSNNSNAFGTNQKGIQPKVPTGLKSTTKHEIQSPQQRKLDEIPFIQSIRQTRPIAPCKKHMINNQRDVPRQTSKISKISKMVKQRSSKISNLKKKRGIKLHHYPNSEQITGWDTSDDFGLSPEMCEHTLEKTQDLQGYPTWDMR
ncbi:unnamed protein product [Moneuplotes crassus]|uniref:Uncharacterized protein n=1 Tax=Euplotes crassus TaxID=5936 RepID=A0AAD1UFS1_EUPCR|nr:unnamed protein product [Moneuplotes crassus]